MKYVRCEDKDHFYKFLDDMEDIGMCWLLSASDKNNYSTFFLKADEALKASDAPTVYIWGAIPRRPTSAQIDEIYETHIDALFRAIEEKCGGAFGAIAREFGRDSFGEFVEQILEDHEPLLDVQVRVSINRAKYHVL